MGEDRRNFLKTLLIGAAGAPALARGQTQPMKSPLSNHGKKSVRVALIQFDAVPEQIERNVRQVELLAERATRLGARWIMFHENTLCDYTPRVKELSQRVPEGAATRRLAKLSQRLRCFISFGLSEKQNERYHITQVFVGPRGYIHRYRKTWLWYEKKDEGFRNEWVRYDPGSGPELFQIDGVRATCFICADGEAERCIDRAASLKPQVAFYPNNRAKLPPFDVFAERAKAISAPMLVTNRVGRSVIYETMGGCVVYSARGEVLAKANRQGKEEILMYNLEI